VCVCVCSRGRQALQEEARGECVNRETQRAKTGRGWRQAYITPSAPAKLVQQARRAVPVLHARWRLELVAPGPDLRIRGSGASSMSHSVQISAHTTQTTSQPDQSSQRLVHNKASPTCSWLTMVRILLRHGSAAINTCQQVVALRHGQGRQQHTHSDVDLCQAGGNRAGVKLPHSKPTLSFVLSAKLGSIAGRRCL
jgi:hypothetical protein